VEKSWQYQYRDRRNKKRDWRRLWITRINAATREHGVRCLCLCARVRLCVCVCMSRVQPWQTRRGLCPSWFLRAQRAFVLTLHRTATG